MGESFQIESSDPDLLEKAAGIARNVTKQFMVDGVAGVMLLGAIPRGYFDHHADIDVAVIQRRHDAVSLEEKFFPVDGVEVHVWLSDYENELARFWDMPKRWTYSQGQIVFDPEGDISRLLDEKVPLRPEERRWLVMSGLTLSEWYINRLTELWLERGSIISAHHMLAQGLNYFFDMLFGLNYQLVPDMKWRLFCVERLERLPTNFTEHISEAMTLHLFTAEELERRKNAFMTMWWEIKPEIEEELQLSFEEMLKIV